MCRPFSSHRSTRPKPVEPSKLCEPRRANRRLGAKLRRITLRVQSDPELLTSRIRLAAAELDFTASRKPLTESERQAVYPATGKVGLRLCHSRPIQRRSTILYSGISFLHRLPSIMSFNDRREMSYDAEGTLKQASFEAQRMKASSDIKSTDNVNQEPKAELPVVASCS